MNVVRKTLFSIDTLTCLSGAALMIEGTIFGEITTSIATVVGIIGIGLIATQRKALQNKGEKNDHE